MLRDTVGKVDTRCVAAFFNPSALRAPPLSHIRAQRRREEYPVRLRDTVGEECRNLLTLSFFCFLTPPSLRATSPIAHTCAEEEINAFLLNCLCFLRLVSILVQHLVMIGHGRGRSENLSLCRNEKYHFQFSPLLISFVMSCGRGGGLILFSLLRDWK